MQRVLKEMLDGGRFHGVPAKRTRTMSAIRSTGNKSTERRLRAFLIRAAVRGWTVHAKDVPGTPEFVFRAAKLAVFTDGCFWHGCPRCVKPPRTNATYWLNKIRLNVERDRRDEAALVADGFRVVRFWEHQISRDPVGCVAAITVLLAGRRRARAGRG